MTRAADGMACGSLNHLDEASACVGAFGLYNFLGWAVGGGQLEGLKTGHFWPSLLGCPLHPITLLLQQSSALNGCKNPIQVLPGE